MGCFDRISAELRHTTSLSPRLLQGSRMDDQTKKIVKMYEDELRIMDIKVLRLFVIAALGWLLVIMLWLFDPVPNILQFAYAGLCMLAMFLVGPLSDLKPEVADRLMRKLGMSHTRKTKTSLMTNKNTDA